MSYLSIPPHHFFKSLAIPAIFIFLGIYIFITIADNKKVDFYANEIVEPLAMNEKNSSTSPATVSELAKIEVVSINSVIEIEPEINSKEIAPETTETPQIVKEEEPAPQEVKIVSAPTQAKPSSVSFSHTLMLESHNSVRAKKGLNDLTWSNKLAESAKAWSVVLKGENCEMRHDYNSPYGENIFWQQQTGGDTSGFVSAAQEAVYWWANEEKFYNYEKNTCARGEQCGHYTQLVWADTTEVGCGVSSCVSGNRRTDVWVCRYNPAGNIIGSYPY